MIGELPLDFLQDEDGDVKVAPERFKDAQEIIEVCRAMVQADSKRVQWRSAIDGLVNGNAAYSLAQLKAKGQGWRARVNYREAEGLLCGRQTAFFDLVSEVDPCVEIGLDFGKGVDTADWATAIAKNIHWMLMKAWRGGFNYHIPLHQMEMLKHGIGYHVWPGEKRFWIPRTPLTGEVLFPDQAKLNVQEDLDYFMLRDFLPGFALYAFIRNEKAAKAMGWNVDAVWSALAQSSKNRNVSDGGQWTTERFQREMKAGDIGTTQSRQSGIWLNTLFTREIESGKVSQYSVAEGVTPKTKKANGDDPWAQCLFRKRDRFDAWPLAMLPYDMGCGGLISTVRGLGARTKDFFELNNRVLNAMVDQVLIGSTITLKQTGNVDTDQLRLARLGMMTILPKGLEAAQGVQLQPLGQGPIALLQQLGRTMATNNETYLQQTPEPTDRETATSYQMRSQNAGQLSKGTHSLYASNYEQVIERMVRTACRKDATIGNSLSAKLARAMQDRCLRDGVPREAFEHIEEVDALLSTGAGSPAARFDAMMTILKFIYPTTTEDRKINIERDLTAYVTSGSKVDRYARSHDDNELPNSDASIAVLENDAMAQGGDAEAAPNQDQVQHVERHLAKANELAQTVMAGQADPAQGLVVLQKFGQHIAQHLKFLQGNPMRKAEFEGFYKEWLALSQIVDKLDQQVKANQQAAQRPSPQEKVSDGLQIGMAKVAATERLGQAKLATQTRLDLTKIGIEGRVQAARLAIERTKARNGATSGSNGSRK